MDRKRTILVVGLCIILAASLSGCVNPVQENNNTSTDGTNAGTTDGNDGGSGDSGDGDGSETAEEIDVDTENMTVECDVQGSVVTPEETQNVDDKYSNAGPAFDVLQAEAMLHRELNELRTTHGNDSVEPLLCDPNLREIAREHSRVMEKFEFIGPEVPEDEIPDDRNVTTNPEYGNLSVRYEGTCREVTETYGRWLYQRNRDIDWESDGLPLNQRDNVNVIENHEELVRDMRGVWFSDRENLSTPLTITELRVVDGDTGQVEGPRETMEYITDSNYTRQGIGMHINRQTREVYVTQVLC